MTFPTNFKDLYKIFNDFCWKKHIDFVDNAP